MENEETIQEIKPEVEEQESETQELIQTKKHSIIKWSIVLVILIGLLFVLFVLVKIINEPLTSPEPIACTDEVKMCSDGTILSRTGPNCEFAECPTDLEDDKTFVDSDLQRYRNEEFGFEFVLPNRWKDVRVEKEDLVSSDGSVTLHFSLPRNGHRIIKDGEYDVVCDIKIYQKVEWEKRQDYWVSGDLPAFVNQKGNVVYSSLCGYDGVGFAGFEEFTKIMTDGEYSLLNSKDIPKPYTEFESSLKTTFGFIDDIGDNENSVYDDADVYINIIDQNNNPVRPDTVEWYYTPNNNFEATCVNKDCTRWAVWGVEEDKIYVTASYRKNHPDKYCLFSAYDATIVDLTLVATPKVTLILEEAVMCQ